MNAHQHTSEDAISLAKTADLPGAGLAISYQRFSSAAQEGGDSLERQTRRAKQWCQMYGFTMIEASFTDKGLSAYSGANAGEGGALHAFIGGLTDGTIPQGVTMVVENLDRVSRQHHQDGIDLFKSITAAGANVLVLSNGRMYRAGQKLELIDTITLSVEFDRAHSESKYKSYRLTEAWGANTEAVLAGDRVRTSTVPGWIKVTGDTKSNPDLKVIESKAQVVREVFTRFASGERPVAIAKALDAAGVPTLKYGKWRGQTISQLLRSEAPFGTLEVGRRATRDEREGSVKLPAGTYRKGHRIITNRVTGYFPRIVNEDLERRVRFLLSEREASGGAPAKEKGPVRPRGGKEAKAALVGVLFADDGVRAIRKIMKSPAYANPVTHAYLGLVQDVDQVLIDYWPEVRKAYAIETTTETEGLEAALDAARDALEYLRGKPGTSPRLLLAAEAEVEDLEGEIKRANDAAGLGMIDLPRDVSGLEAHEVNSLCRRIMTEVRLHKSIKMVPSQSKRTRGKMIGQASYDLRVTMRNGVRLTLGEGLSGLGVHG